MGFAINVLAVLTGSLGLARGIALSDFRPETTGLSGSCQDAYSTVIQGCTVADFSPGTGCSSECLNGLVQINALISTACQNVPVPNTSLVGIFLQGKGIRALCNIEVVTKTTSSSAPTNTPLGPVPKSTSSLPPANTVPTTLTVGVGPPSSSALSTMTVMSSSDTNKPAPTEKSPPTGKSSSEPAASSVTAAQAVSPKLPKCSQGAGSPFDNAPGQSCTNAGSTLGVSLVICITALVATLLSQAVLA